MPDGTAKRGGYTVAAEREGCAFKFNLQRIVLCERRSLTYKNNISYSAIEDIVIYRMPAGELNHIINTDIYLIDQILKGRYNSGGKLLDAGCGGGRNISWFVMQSNFDIYAVDTDQSAIHHLLRNYPSLRQDQLYCTPVQSLPFPDSFFHHIICSAVLHFAGNKEDFLQMFFELNRVLKPGGSLFIRAASDIGIENRILPLGVGKVFIARWLG